MQKLLALLLVVAMSATAQERTMIPDWPEEAPRAPRSFVPLANQPNPNVPLPQDALLVPTLETILAAREDMQVGLVAVDLGRGDDNPLWQMSQTALTVFLNKLATLDERPVADDGIWPNIPKPDPRYNGILVMLQTKEGRRFVPFRVFMGNMAVGPDYQVAKDPGRAMEYWLFGTARVRRDQLIGASVLPVYTFDQCRSLGQRVIETTPRQCLLANNNLLLETAERPTLQSAKITTFAECLKQGTGLIYTFPRRCVAAGGRVLTEPPIIYEAEKPLAADAPVKARGTKRLAPNKVSDTVVTPTSLLPIAITPTATATPTAPPPLARMGEGLLRTTSPTGRTWRDLNGKQ
jgi:hypothetical protein